MILNQFQNNYMPRGRSDGYPAPGLDHFKKIPERDLNWFIRTIKDPVAPVYFFNLKGEQGIISIFDRTTAYRLYNAQAVGYRFLSLTERAKQAVPISADSIF